MFRAPSQAGLPPLDFLLSDVPATPAQVARHLGISPATLARYRATEQAPRAVMLALFWESRWGRSAADCEAVNWAAQSHHESQVLRRENAALRRQIESLELQLTQGASHAANAPFYAIGAS